MCAHSAAIGVFDSGVGGLSVLRELRHLLPDEHYIYLGDSARVPYGSKSAETVQLCLRQPRSTPSCWAAPAIPCSNSCSKSFCPG